MKAKLEEAVNETGESVKAQINMLNKSMEQEIEQVMSAMGNALAQISEKFTEDYRRLTQQMQRIVQANETRR